MESTPEAHIKRVKKHLDQGRETIKDLRTLQTYDVPDVTPDMTQLSLDPPHEDDPYVFFLSSFSIMAQHFCSFRLLSAFFQVLHRDGRAQFIGIGYHCFEGRGFHG